MAGGSCKQGAGRDRLRRASGWPVFVRFRASEIWRHGPRAKGWRWVGAGRLCQTETAGGGLGIIASHLIGYPVGGSGRKAPPEAYSCVA